MVKSSGKMRLEELVEVYEHDLKRMNFQTKSSIPPPRQTYTPKVTKFLPTPPNTALARRQAHPQGTALANATTLNEQRRNRGGMGSSGGWDGGDSGWSGWSGIRWRRRSSGRRGSRSHEEKDDADRSRADWERYKKRKKEQDDLEKVKQKDEDARDKAEADRLKKKQQRIRRMGSLTKHLRDKEYQRAKDQRKEEEKAKEQTKSIIGTLFQKAVKEMGFKHTAIGIGQYRGARKAGMGRAKAGTLGIGMGALGYIGEAYRYAGQVNQSMLKSYGPVGQKIQGVGNMFNRFGMLFDPTEMGPMAAQMARATGKYNQRDLKARAMAERGGVGTEFTGLVESLTQTGMKTEKTTQDILQKSFEAALASKLERGRFGEYIKGVTTLVKSIPTGAKASVSEVNKQMVGLSGVGIQGARAASTMSKMESSLQKSTYLKAIAGGYGKGNVDFATAVVEGSKGFMSKGGIKRGERVIDHIIDNMGGIQPGKIYTEREINEMVVVAKQQFFQNMPEIQVKRLIQKRIKELGGTLDVDSMMKKGAKRLGGGKGMKQMVTPGGTLALHAGRRLLAKSLQKRVGEAAAPTIVALSNGLNNAGLMALKGLTKLSNALENVYNKYFKPKTTTEDVQKRVKAQAQKEEMEKKKEKTSYWGRIVQSISGGGRGGFDAGRPAKGIKPSPVKLEGQATVDVNIKGAGIDKKVQAGMVLREGSKGKKKKIPKTQTPSQRK